MSRFSVIIPALNEERYIATCIESLLKQDFKDFEALIVDGLSTDKTHEIVLKYCAMDPRIRLIKNPKKITPSAFNIGIQNSVGEIILTVGAHWSLSENYLSSIHEVCKKYPDINCFGGRIVRIVDSDRGRAIEMARGTLLGGGLSLRNVLSQERIVTLPNVAYIWRREVFMRVGLFDERFIKNQDNEFNLRTLESGMKTLYSPSVYFNYYAPDTYGKLFRQLCGYTSYMPIMTVKHHRLLSVRFALPLIGLLIWLFLLCIALLGKLNGLLPAGLLVFYFVVTLFFSYYTSAKSKAHKLWLSIFISLVITHIAVSLGYLFGMLKLLNIPLFLSLWKDPWMKGVKNYAR